MFLCVHFTRVSIVLVAKSHLCRGVREVFVDLARDREERNALFLVHAESDEGVLQLPKQNVTLRTKQASDQAILVRVISGKPLIRSALTPTTKSTHTLLESFDTIPLLDREFERVEKPLCSCLVICHSIYSKELGNEFFKTPPPMENENGSIE
jgi:hypothetical protein